MPRKDFNEVAFSVVQRVTGQLPKETKTADQMAAAEHGKRGGQKRAKSLSKKRRIAIAKVAAKARWPKKEPAKRAGSKVTA